MLDKWSRESVMLEASFSLTGQSVVEALKTIALNHPLPKAITIDHGAEFTSTIARRVGLEPQREGRFHAAGQA